MLFFPFSGGKENWMDTMRLTGRGWAESSKRTLRSTDLPDLLTGKITNEMPNHMPSCMYVKEGIRNMVRTAAHADRTMMQGAPREACWGAQVFSVDSIFIKKWVE